MSNLLNTSSNTAIVATGMTSISGGLSGTSISSGSVVSSGITLGNVLTSTGTYTIGPSDEMIDFYELILTALGHDISYQDFCNMSKQQRKSLIRDIKLKRLID